jgi:hypothetical protein
MVNVRETISRKLQEHGRSMSWLSRELGRNHAYVQQFLMRHSPQDLEFNDKLKISKLLNVPMQDLGVELDEQLQSSDRATGLADEAETYDPPHGSILSRAPHIAYFRSRSSALDRHPLQIRNGDIVAVDIGTGALERIKSGDAVVVQLYLKPECMAALTVLRQFIEPGLLITNSSETNAIWRIDDETLPFEPVIKGRIESVIRGLNV